MRLIDAYPCEYNEQGSLSLAEVKGSKGTVCAPGVEGLQYPFTKKRIKIIKIDVRINN